VKPCPPRRRSARRPQVLNHRLPGRRRPCDARFTGRGSRGRGSVPEPSALRASTKNNPAAASNAASTKRNASTAVPCSSWRCTFGASTAPPVGDQHSGYAGTGLAVPSSRSRTQRTRRHVATRGWSCNASFSPQPPIRSSECRARSARRFAEVIRRRSDTEITTDVVIAANT